MLNFAYLLKLWLSSWKCLQVVIVLTVSHHFFRWFLKVAVFCTCLQQSDLTFVKHGEHFPGFSFHICLFLTLFFSVLSLSINSLRFWFCLNAVIVWKLIISFRDSCIASNTSNVFVSLYWCLDKRDCKLMLVKYMFFSAFL